MMYHLRTRVRAAAGIANRKMNATMISAMKAIIRISPDLIKPVLSKYWPTTKKIAIAIAKTKNSAKTPTKLKLTGPIFPFAILVEAL